MINTLRPRQNGRHFSDDTFKRFFLNENVRISIKISLKLVPGVRINNITVLVQIMAWRWPGDKPLSVPMMVRLPTHICVTRPQWVNEYIEWHADSKVLMDVWKYFSKTMLVLLKYSYNRSRLLFTFHIRILYRVLHAFWLVVFVVFGAVDKPSASYMSVHIGIFIRNKLDFP